MTEKILTIDALAFGGEGVGRSEGKVVFVPWTVPGDRVRVRIVSDHDRFERAELIEILEKSPCRVEAPCPIFGLCGGCQWQHLSYENQLRWKEEILRETLKRIGRIGDVNLLPILASPKPWNYRNRIQLKVNAGGLIGFHRFKSREIVSFEECKIADARLNQKLSEIRSNGNRPSRDFELSVGESDGVRLGEMSEERVFHQVNSGQNLNLIQAVLFAAFGNAEAPFNRKKTVVELYAGAGNFSFPLSERAGGVIAVEENSEAVSEGESLAEERGVQNLEWIQGTAEWGLKKIYRAKKTVDLLVLDPPRRGAKEIIDLVCVIRPRVVVYVSCDPVTLARDLNLLVRRYYRLEQVQPIDMFPQTYHIESVAKLVLI